MSQTEGKIRKHIKAVRIAGVLFLISGVVFLFLIYTPVISAYWKYLNSQKDNTPEIQLAQEDQVNTEIADDTKIVFVDKNFGIYIPKIQTNAKIIANVDTTNSKEYLEALKTGVAHAKGSSYPNQKGNVFLFAHSAVDFYHQKDYSVYFYLLGELKPQDKIYISYKDNLYEYSVIETRIVSKTDTQYMGQYLDQDTLTLMTCWPAGTNLKRIIVTAVRAITY